MLYEAIVRGIAATIGILSPERAAAYLRGHQDLTRAYDAGKVAGLDRGYNPPTKTGDLEIGADWRTVTNKSRDSMRNNGFIANSMRISTAFTVGMAIWPKPRIKNDDGTVDRILSKKALIAFSKWAEKCCVNGNDWDDLKKLAFKHLKADGEFLIHEASTEVHPFQLELLESDQIDSSVDSWGGTVPVGIAPGNRAIRGIEFNRYGRPVAYWLLDAHPGDSIFTTKSRRVPAEQIHHVFDPNRATETRGICDFVSSIIPAYSHQQHRFAVMDLLRIAAAYGIFIESDYPEDFMVAPNTEPAKTSENLDDSKIYAPKSYVTPAGIHVLRKGEKVSHAKPEQPTAAFKEVEQSNLRLSAAGMGLSFETHTGDLSNVNYASLRGGQINERMNFRMDTDLIIRKFAGKIYPRVQDVQALLGTLRLPGYWSQRERYHEVSWSLPGFPTTDPAKEEIADEKAIANKTTSRRIICERKGVDFDDLVDEIEYENKLMEKKGISTSAEPTDPAVIAALLTDDNGKPNEAGKPSSDKKGK